MKYNELTRRMFLQGSGKFLLSIPLMPSLLPRALAQAVNDIPPRYVQWITNHGVYPDQFWPKVTPAQRLTINGQVVPDLAYVGLNSIAGSLSTLLGTAFDPLRGKMNVIKGLSGIVGDQWHNGCFPTTAANPVTDEGIASFPYSVDAVLAASSKIYPTAARVAALRLTPGVDYNYKWGSYCWTASANGTPQRLPCYDSNVTALNALFGNASTSVDDKILMRKQVTDLVYEDYRRLSLSGKLSSEDKNHLNHYMELISDLQKRMVASTNACTKPTLPQQVDFGVLHSNAADLVVAALMCGATKVVAYHCFQGSNTSYDEELFHKWAHDEPSKHTVFMNWRLQQLAMLAKKMDAVVESNGKTLLDNSLVFASNELSDPGHGASHLKDMPVMTFGSASGRLTTGNYINYTRRPYNNMLVTLFHAMGLTNPADYEKRNVVGYGKYSGFLVKHVNSAYLTDAEKRKPLPLLLAA